MNDTIIEKRINDLCLLKEYYIVESGFSTDDATEIIDENRGHLYVKEFLPIHDENDESIDQEPEQGLSTLIRIRIQTSLYSSNERIIQRNGPL